MKKFIFILSVGLSLLISCTKEIDASRIVTNKQKAQSVYGYVACTVTTHSPIIDKPVIENGLRCYFSNVEKCSLLSDCVIKKSVSDWLNNHYTQSEIDSLVKYQTPMTNPELINLFLN
jgi:hypothetical protein